jgi:hypothetical protein
MPLKQDIKAFSGIAVRANALKNKNWWNNVKRTILTRPENRRV